MATRYRRLSCNQLGGFEQLERRLLFSGQTIAAGAFSQPALVGSVLAGLNAAPQHAQGGNQGNSNVTTLTTTLSSSGETATITYQTGKVLGISETQLTVSVAGAAADSSLNVSIAGIVVGTVSTNASGAGTLVLSSNPQSGQQALPSDFPSSVSSGTAVTVDTMSGTLAVPGASQGTLLSASLTDATNSSASGTVTYQSSTVNGTSQTMLTVVISGETADTTYNVSIGGTVVGQVTTNSSGAGSLVLSSNPKGLEQPLPSDFPSSVTSGAAVTVGPLSGAFAVSTQTAPTVYTAQLGTSGSETAMVVYETGTVRGVSETFFSVSLKGAAADTTVNVSIGGTVVGTITTNANGYGSLVLSSNPKGSQQSLPSDFPTSITVGTAITVDTLSGTLAVPTSTGPSGGCSGGMGSSGSGIAQVAASLVKSLIRR